ncbi:MAG: hypothetical protein O2780_11815 [Proteobacteria bacterium]|jgi:hypothetical protein|nr:hypothetical protein [Pseudomonadota bacterium]MDA1301124.1 hypothetical protein [Pseudomonadota bacterium]
MNTNKADIIQFPAPDRQRNIIVLKAVGETVEAKMNYLFEGLLANASNALFEEMWAAERQEALIRQFNVMRFLRIQASGYRGAFNGMMATAWAAIGNGVSFEIAPPEGPVCELVHVNSRRISNHYKVITREIESRLSELMGHPVSDCPLRPETFYGAFWHTTLETKLTYHERFMLMILFHRFVMDRFGQLLTAANNTLINLRVDQHLG